MDYISQFTSDTRHVKGIYNHVADALSRLHVDALHTSSLVDFHQLVVDLEDNDEWPEVQHSPSLTFKCVPLPTNNGHIWCDTSTGHERPFVPKKHRRTDFNALHCMSHPGTKSTRKLIGSRVVWPNMHKDIQAWTKTCISCQKAKVHQHAKAPLGTYVTHDARFQHIHIELVGPLPGVGEPQISVGKMCIIII